MKCEKHENELFALNFSTNNSKTAKTACLWKKLPNWSNFLLNKYEKTREFRQQKLNKNGFSSFFKILSIRNDMENKVLQEKKNVCITHALPTSHIFFKSKKKKCFPHFITLTH